MLKLYPVMLHSPSTSYIYHKDKYQCVRKVIDQLFCHFSRATDTRGVHKKRVTLKEICFRQISIDLIRFKSQKICISILEIQLHHIVYIYAKSTNIYTYIYICTLLLKEFDILINFT